MFDIRCRQLMKILFPELMLIFVYVCVAFFCKLLMNNNSVCWMTFVRWLIEASFFPMTILVLVGGSYINLWDEYLLEHDPRAIPTMACMTKGILFVVMRYAEMYPSSENQIEFFYHICG